MTKEVDKIYLFNTLSREVEEYKPIHKGKVHLYTCGPTVYGRAHIGNLRTYINSDILRRTFELAGYEVVHVMNITDVGHLTSDADTGEDKLQKTAQKERVSAWDIAKKYTEFFFSDEKKLNILKPKIVCEATKHIPEQIALVKKLEKNGYTYKTTDGIYFDTSKFNDYGKMAKLNIEGLQAGKRIELGEKRNKTDFALWKFSPKDEKRDMEWDSPWGVGFPGWHIECSAMSMKYLGDNFDIHTGGIDHIPIHHTNEIAQAECATHHKFVNYWVHSEFLVMSENEKMSKSLGNVLNLDTINKKGYSSMAFRMLCLGAHYRKRLLFDEDILKSAQNSYETLKTKIIALKQEIKNEISETDGSELAKKYVTQFKKELFYDFNAPQGLATMWEVIKDNNLSPEEKYSVLLIFDKVIGLDIASMKAQIVKIPSEIQEIVDEREQFRKEKNWAKADELREKIEKSGFIVKDSSDGPILEKK